MINSISIPVGAVVATENFIGKDVINQENLSRLEDSICEMLKDQDWLRQEKNKTLIGLGGTIRNLGKIHRNRIEYPINYTHNYEIPMKILTAYIMTLQIWI